MVQSHHRQQADVNGRTRIIVAVVIVVVILVAVIAFAVIHMNGTSAGNQHSGTSTQTSQTSPSTSGDQSKDGNQSKDNGSSSSDGNSPVIEETVPDEPGDGDASVDFGQMQQSQQSSSAQ